MNRREEEFFPSPRKDRLLYDPERVPSALAPLPTQQTTFWWHDSPPLGRVPPLDERIRWGRAFSIIVDHRLKAENWIAECVTVGFDILAETLTIDPDIRGGVPVLHGTRFTAAQALAEIAETSGVEEFADKFDIDVKLVRDMLEGLSLILQRRCVR